MIFQCHNNVNNIQHFTIIASPIYLAWYIGLPPFPGKGNEDTERFGNNVQRIEGREIVRFDFARFVIYARPEVEGSWRGIPVTQRRYTIRKTSSDFLRFISWTGTLFPGVRRRRRCRVVTPETYPLRIEPVCTCSYKSLQDIT